MDQYFTQPLWVRTAFSVLLTMGTLGHSLNEGLEDLSVMTIETNGTDAYIGTYYDGVFQWKENRKRWERIGSLRRRVDSLVMHDGSLYAGTVGGGVFRVSIGK